MNYKLTSSMVVTRARGLLPDGVPATKEGNCAFCGCEIRPGDPCVPFSAGGAFMDDLSLAARGSDMTCGYCVHSLSADGLRNTSHGAFSLDSGVLPFRKWADVTNALLEPPKPPFVMLYATANNQHMAWRAPVNYSRDLFYVRVGLRDLKIRRPRLIEAVRVCERVALATMRKDDVRRKDDPKRKTLLNPFATLSPDLKDVFHADLAAEMRRNSTDDYAHLLDDPRYQADLLFLKGLTLGETWALRFVLTPNAGIAADQ